MPQFLYTTLATPIGTCALVWSGERIAGSFLPEADEARLHRRVRNRFPGAETASPPPIIAEAAKKVVSLLEGQPIDLSTLPIDLDAAGDFERQVYAAALEIPPGQVRTYGEIAETIGNSGAARAVGVALGRNPFPIIVPCHRVLAADGGTGGFSAPGGVSTKLKMLEIEGARRSPEPELFDKLPWAAKPAR